MLVGIVSATFAVAQTETPKPTEKPRGNGAEVGSGSETAPEGTRQIQPNPASTTPFRILLKPRATYTDAARSNDVEGSVRVKVTLLASGEIGSITPINTLPFGLTEQAIAAARQIRFTPKIVNGIPVSVIVTIDYSFSFYYSEDEKEVAKKAKIVAMPNPEFPSGGLLGNGKGKLGVNILLSSSGKASIISIEAPVTKDTEQIVRDAVAKIVFEPAKRADDTNISVSRKVFYELKPTK